MPTFTVAGVIAQVQLEIDREDLKAASVWVSWLCRQGEQEAYSLARGMLREAGWDG